MDRMVVILRVRCDVGEREAEGDGKGEDVVVEGVRTTRSGELGY